MYTLKKISFLFICSVVLALLNGYIQKVPFITPPSISIDKKLENMKEKVPAGVTIVNYDELTDAIENHTKKIIDARSKEKFSAGHIDGAIHIPSANVNEASLDFMNEFGPDTPILIYCDGPDCMASIVVAEFFKSYSYENVSVYLEGYDSWAKKH